MGETVTKCPVELEFIVLENILKASSWTILGEQAAMGMIHTSSYEPNEMVVMQVFHLERRRSRVSSVKVMDRRKLDESQKETLKREIYMSLMFLT